MKNIIVSILLIFNVIAIYDTPEIKHITHPDMLYLEEIMKPFKTKHKKRIREQIFYQAHKYGHPVRLLGRLVRAESGFKRTAISHKKARGLGQIKNCWNHLMYYCRDKQFGRYLHEQKVIDHRPYYYFIGINLEMTARILRKWYDKYGSYELALVAYNTGQNSTFFRKCLKDPSMATRYAYARDIMGE